MDKIIENIRCETTTIVEENIDIQRDEQLVDEDKRE